MTFIFLRMILPVTVTVSNGAQITNGVITFSLIIFSRNVFFVNISHTSCDHTVLCTLCLVFL